MIKAIPTEYKGILFRSRLEARWGPQTVAPSSSQDSVTV